MLRGKSYLLNKNVINRIDSGGHLGVAQRYHVCTFFVIDNITNQIGYLILIDGGNGQVLYISDGQPIGISGHSSVFVYLSGGHGYGGWDRG
jgi:hypothetical protein